MRQIIILVLTIFLFCSCASDRHRKWMVIVEPLGKPADTIYVEGDHIENLGYHGVNVYDKRRGSFLRINYPSSVIMDVRYAVEIK